MKNSDYKDLAPSSDINLCPLFLFLQDTPLQLLQELTCEGFEVRCVETVLGVKTYLHFLKDLGLLHFQSSREFNLEALNVFLLDSNSRQAVPVKAIVRTVEHVSDKDVDLNPPPLHLSLSNYFFFKYHFKVCSSVSLMQPLHTVIWCVLLLCLHMAQ